MGREQNEPEGQSRLPHLHRSLRADEASRGSQISLDLIAKSLNVAVAELSVIRVNYMYCSVWVYRVPIGICSSTYRIVFF